MAERPGFAELFAALPVATLVVDPEDRIVHANALAEGLLNLSERVMRGQPLAAILPPPEKSSRDGHGLAVYDVEIATPRGRIRVDYAAVTLGDYPGWRVISLHAAASTRGLGHSADRVAGARAASGAAAMLAHEIKNPLSGIRGAAQLIGAGELTTLIVTEVDRIAALIDRMQDFSDTRPRPVAAENIYPLIGHARTLALAGFARGLTIEERFDPSLPPALVNRDALLQILINLLKNAQEATRIVRQPRLILTTAYRHGMSVSAAAGRPRVPLPIEICVIDNGPGAPADIADHLFDPFVSGRPEGQGLGLALVDKLMRDMGGIVQYAREGTPEMTILRLLLPRAAS
ncbi:MULTISPECIES: nitrogen regulation protein NR(II) [unclassified Sphingomonas]|uniref:two-component system sensor histidine kinase NtrB n=1 Tax=unclassified Sphingomonas TaxID=196159 RepID=UPI000E10C293|nr:MULTISPECIES: ATP-binding protein [unclassified Sphingomonas]AXJ96535.1 two-component sensor histidine kinase [Sphingomonas sp. FARSPH]